MTADEGLFSGAALWILGAAALLWAFWRLRRLARVAAAYKAKILCSVLFISGRDADPQTAPEVSADHYRQMRLFRTQVDRLEKSVTVSLFGLWPRKAVHQPAPGGARKSAPLPRAAPPSGLERVIEEAFSEPDPKRLRRTRAILVMRDGRVIGERYAPGFSERTPLPGWSMTKSVLGALIGILVREGRLSLGDKRLLPQWNDARAEITLEDLLRMRSGLKFAEVYSDLSSDVIKMLFLEPDAAGYAASLPLEAGPGERWRYSSGTTNILSAIMRRAVGQSAYPSWPRRSLFDPVGMDSAVLEADASGTFVGSSFMHATAGDWARFGQLHLQDGIWNGRRILPEGWVAFGASPTPQSPEKRYGAHWWLKLQKELGGESAAAKNIPPDAFYALGHEGQTLTIIPSRGLVAVRLGMSIHIDAWNHAEFLAGLLKAV